MLGRDVQSEHLGCFQCTNLQLPLTLLSSTLAGLLPPGKSGGETCIGVGICMGPNSADEKDGTLSRGGSGCRMPATCCTPSSSSENRGSSIGSASIGSLSTVDWVPASEPRTFNQLQQLLCTPLQPGACFGATYPSKQQLSCTKRDCLELWTAISTSLRSLGQVLCPARQGAAQQSWAKGCCYLAKGCSAKVQGLWTWPCAPPAKLR